MAITNVYLLPESQFIIEFDDKAPAVGSGNFALLEGVQAWLDTPNTPVPASPITAAHQAAARAYQKSVVRSGKRKEMSLIFSNVDPIEFAAFFSGDSTLTQGDNNYTVNTILTDINTEVTTVDAAIDLETDIPTIFNLFYTPQHPELNGGTLS